ncbi:MAG: hypothetical protein EOO77_10830 [Oxalobacteraceae bacterium]|nr:MAG: hypothetical protein EOO77_10830 [Oxalobacteraceae bacterium]
MAIRLRLQKVTETHPERGWAPAEFYDMVAGDEVVGTIQLRLGNTDYMRLYGGQVGYRLSQNIAGTAMRARR